MTARSVSPSSQIAWWLAICAAMVFAMVVLGGATRLTESGLSIVEWKPLTVTPPMNAEQWQVEFENYQHSPQFKKENGWMTVEDFKGIFWLEYLHRLWGRIIGAAFLLPFLWFVYKGAVDRPLGWRLGGLFLLGGAQGALGWYMVASGLLERPDVSQYRLAAHLFTALVLYGALIWTSLDLFRRDKPVHTANQNFADWCLAIAGFVLFVMTSGAFVAGLDGGIIYNTFPLMDGKVIPDGLYEQGASSPFEDIKTVQFNHRVLAITLVALVTATWVWARKVPLDTQGRKLAHILLAVAFAQALLGISTLVTVVALPLALAHQATALILFTFALCLAHNVRTPSADKLAPQ
jgi:heme a synthase